MQRVTGVTMEPRAAVGAWNAASARYTIHAGRAASDGPDGGPGLGVRKCRSCDCGDVGGNFGTRNSFYPRSRWSLAGGASTAP